MFFPGEEHPVTANLLGLKTMYVHSETKRFIVIPFNNVEIQKTENPKLYHNTRIKTTDNEQCPDRIPITALRLRLSSPTSILVAPISIFGYRAFDILLSDPG
ncbi:hypothetical protein FF38_02884 [Lucilia cuprina]|uniref:Uncharacterized protein n=1 Tax=Lucilia cuprina TaxID=7375 RepID=A0A0L0C9G3_LUCCU|nr:hypothetical protein FF38_02884 [Lucilia cuprina]